MIRVIPDTTQDKSSFQLSKLLSLLHPQLKDSFMVLSQSMLKCPIQHYSSSQAEEVFTRLADKRKSQKERKNWKNDETNYLFYVMDKYCILNDIQPTDLESADWQAISCYVPGRSGNDCKFRFMAMTAKTLADAPWNSNQKQLLVRIIQTQKSRSLNWKKISQKLYDLNGGKLYRTGKQCREQYSCFLNPSLKKGTWTIQEDYLLICLFEKYGRKWSLIAKDFQGRNQNAIKNRFFLLFQQKNALTLSNSDLNKRIKRRKEKIQRQQLLQRFQCSSLEQSIPKLTQLKFSQKTTETQESINEYSESELSPQGLRGEFFVQINTPFPAPNQDIFFSSNQGEEMLNYMNF